MVDSRLRGHGPLETSQRLNKRKPLLVRRRRGRHDEDEIKCDFDAHDDNGHHDSINEIPVEDVVLQTLRAVDDFSSVMCPACNTPMHLRMGRTKPFFQCRCTQHQRC